MLRSLAVMTALMLGTVSANASVLDMTEAGSGNLGQSSAHLSDATLHSGSDGLYVGAGGIANSICALDSKNWSCANDLYLGFTSTVENLSFEVGGFQSGDKARLSIFNAAGQVAGKLKIARGGLFDLSGFGEISALFFDDRSKSRGVSYGNFTYDAVAPVPLPASLPLLLAGIGLIGFARKKRKSA